MRPKGSIDLVRHGSPYRVHPACPRTPILPDPHAKSGLRGGGLAFGVGSL